MRQHTDRARCMPGILRIACKLLINDRAKFAALLVGNANRPYGGAERAS
jgi:hypothetical protein